MGVQGGGLMFGISPIFEPSARRNRTTGQKFKFSKFLHNIFVGAPDEADFQG